MASFRSGFLACVAAMGMATAGAGQARPGTQAAYPPVFTGTYAIRICHGACMESNRPFRTGTLVLLGQPVRDRRGHVLRVSMETRPANGCFVLAAAGERPVRGWIAWSPQRDSADAISFQLYRSPDGGYGVWLKLSAAGLEGRGSVWGGAVDETVHATDDHAPLPFDGIVAERVGDADPALCPVPAQASG
ncbi:hypothetical protein QMK61_05570 [Fulvimonas sp. R45]|uniref:hypothetical protein n=1 Tax=Fulvimonas sp. R45 TaxID=3045937 RepID=UPI00265DA267|nr:hypothetical protein [Fulvimonas sp. R45]MDO1528300.1 hypothetical protein [Fulvimonas sp. R45]